MFGAEEGYQLCQFSGRDRLLEAWHLLAAVEDLMGNLFGVEGLANIGQGWPLLGSQAGWSMAVCAAFVAEEDGSCLLRILPGKRMRGNGEKEEWQEQSGGCVGAGKSLHKCRLLSVAGYGLSVAASGEI